eukprot:scaffold2134_cov384-Prasinococcus_capsulatus_cf.AAC.12
MGPNGPPLGPRDAGRARASLTTPRRALGPAHHHHHRLPSSASASASASSILRPRVVGAGGVVGGGGSFLPAGIEMLQGGDRCAGRGGWTAGGIASRSPFARWRARRRP